MRKDLQDLERMNMEGTLEKNQDKGVDLEVSVQNVLDHTRNYDPEADPEPEFKDLGPEIVDLIRNPFLGEDLCLEEDVSRRKEGQHPEEDLHLGKDHFLEEDRDLFLANEDLYQEEDPGDQFQGLEDRYQDHDREDLYQDPEGHCLDLVIDVKIRKSTNLVVGRRIGSDLGQNHLGNLRNREKGSFRKERLKVDQDLEEDLVLEIGNK